MWGGRVATAEAKEGDTLVALEIVAISHSYHVAAVRRIIHFCFRATDSMSQQLGSEVERQSKANKSTTPRTALSFQRKEEELPWVGFEPTTLRSLGERSTN